VAHTQRRLNRRTTSKSCHWDRQTDLEERDGVLPLLVLHKRAQRADHILRVDKFDRLILAVVVLALLRLVVFLPSRAEPS
jgi:hypothetical protein